jgi:hypothetical protein
MLYSEAGVRQNGDTGDLHLGCVCVCVCVCVRVCVCVGGEGGGIVYTFLYGGPTTQLHTHNHKTKHMKSNHKRRTCEHHSSIYAVAMLAVLPVRPWVGPQPRSMHAQEGAPQPTEGGREMCLHRYRTKPKDTNLIETEDGTQRTDGHLIALFIWLSFMYFELY